MQLEQNFLTDLEKRFKSYKSLGDDTFKQLEENDFYFKPSEESNSIAIIIQHMYGNMMSRFTNFLTEDGEKQWRKRDAEFEASDTTTKDLLDFWQTGWNCVFKAIADIKPEELMNTVYIRSEPLSAFDAFLRQLAHYAYHVGQIVMIGKMLKDKHWQSLSIPKTKK
jgi:hypothetical protein